MITAPLPHRRANARSFIASLLMVSLVALIALPQTSLGQATSTWVFYDHLGKLRYATDPAGNRIIDYSSAGYRGGGVSLPKVPVRITVSPGGGDDTSAIQTALDTVAALPPDRKGFRGAVLLSPGYFNVSATLILNASGVVLRGSGSGSDGSVINMSGTPFTLLSVGGSGTYVRGTPASIVDTYIPSGARSFKVNDASGFKIGDNVLVIRPVTEAWVAFMNMDKLVRNGLPQTWLAPGTEILTDRRIAAVWGNRIILDVPLTDSFDAQYFGPPGASVVTYTFDGRISQVGVEHFSVVAPPEASTSPYYQGVQLNNVLNGWVRDLTFQDTHNTFQLTNTTKQVTLDSIRVVHTYRQPASGAPADFALSGTQLLANNCSVTGQGNTWPFVTHARVTGPIVILKAFGDDRGYAPHQRWATGLLCDMCDFPSSYTADKTGIAYSNRGFFGSGHGWDAGFSVAWNVTSTYFLVQEPPGAHNWCIGCVGTIHSDDAPGGDGTILPNGIYDSLGAHVTPGSLYLAQLKQRLGMRALRNIGYADVNGTPLPAN